MPSWTVPAPAATRVPEATEADRLLGRDVRIADGELAVSPAGDWQTVEGPAALQQSILHEAMTEPGELPHRPSYGMGLASMLKGPLIKARLDAARSRVLERMAANSRVAKVREAALEVVTIGDRRGLRVTLRADGHDGQDLRLRPFVLLEEGV